jgi:hypothetical protein
MSKEKNKKQTKQKDNPYALNSGVLGFWYLLLLLLPDKYLIIISKVIYL